MPGWASTSPVSPRMSIPEIRGVAAGDRHRPLEALVLAGDPALEGADSLLHPLGVARLCCPASVRA